MFCTSCGIEVNEEGLFCSSCGSEIVINYREQPPGINDEKELISYYFRKGYKYKTIALFLKLQHNTTTISKFRFTEDIIQYNRGKLDANNI